MQFIDLNSQQARIRTDIDRRIAAVLNHGQYVLGPEVTELETRLAAYVGTHYCISVGSGTDALLIALMALGIGPGDAVITTPFTFFATGEVIALLGAIPIYVDIEPRTYNLDPAQLEAAITPQVRAILPVSLYGQCANLTAINIIAHRHNLPVIEDAAQSFGATHNGYRSGGLTTIGCTSFFPSKPLGCYGEGGAVFTNDAGLAQQAQVIRVHGQDRRYHHARLGLNGRLETLQAAILLAKLEIFADEIQRRASLAAYYTAHLAAIPSIIPPWIASGNTSVYGQYTIQVPSRDALIARLAQAQIPSAVHYPIPLYRQPALYQDGLRLAVTEHAAAHVLSLPFHPYLTETQIEHVCDVLAAALT